MAEFQRLFKILRDAGNDKNANVNGSVTPVPFYVEAGAGETWAIHRFTVFIRDTGVFDVERYGANLAISNGVGVKVVRADASELDLLDNDPIHSNGEWMAHAENWQHTSIGVGDEAIAASWNFDDGGGPIILGAGDRLVVTVSDDLTGLVRHEFGVEGIST